ncbi:MAG TPA: ATP-binding protein [Anaerolineae bacterium]|nr:ATP-binding protein [Anaerolineae bacterium]
MEGSVLFDSRIAIFAGRFGSGKTEVAVNYAVRLAQERERVALVDLDLVTPYYRTRETAQILAQRGVEVIAPPAATRQLHVPAVTAEILAALQDRERPVVLDVGGDEEGTRAGLGQFSRSLARMDYILSLVVNPYRQHTSTVEGIAQALEQIERGSGLRVSRLVSNPNLIEETTLAVVEEGHSLIEEASRELGLPIAFICLEERLAREVPRAHFQQPLLPLVRYFLLPWE